VKFEFFFLVLFFSNMSTSGRRVWPGSVLLALVMVSISSSVHFAGATVLELGAGSGLASIVASRLGSKYVVVSDGDQGSVDIATTNLTTNGIECTPHSHELVGVKTSRLLWGQHDEFKRDETLMPGSGFSIILAADVMYKPSLPHILFKTMKDLLAEDGVGLLVHLVRAGVTQEFVQQTAKEFGFEISALPKPMDQLPHDHCSLEDADLSCVYLLRHARI
jgi:predicted nicotinamide N-methyase